MNAQIIMTETVNRRARERVIGMRVAYSLLDTQFNGVKA